MSTSTESDGEVVQEADNKDAAHEMVHDRVIDSSAAQWRSEVYEIS